MSPIALPRRRWLVTGLDSFSCRFLRASSVVLALVVLTSCSEGISRSILTTVLRVEAGAEAAPNEKASFQPLTENSTVSAGSVIRTNNGTIDLQIAPGAQLRLEPNSELRLEQMTLAKDGNETASAMSNRIARLRLGHGTAVVYIQDSDGPWGTFTLVTNRVVITSRNGCLFRVAANADETRLVCVRGSLSASAPGVPPSTIEDGLFGEWPAGRGALPADQDPDAQKSVAEALRTAEQLDDLREQRPPYIPR